MSKYKTATPWNVELIRRAIEYLRAAETSLDYENFDWGRFPTEEDAPLIAAAPELLSALEACVSWMANSPVRVHAKSVIAKAKGVS